MFISSSTRATWGLRGRTTVASRRAVGGTCCCSTATPSRLTDALEMLVAFMDAHPEAGVVGPRLLRPDGTAQPYAFGGDPTLGYLLRRGCNRLRGRYLHDWDTNAVQEVDWVSGVCMMARRAAIEQAEPLDESIFMYFEDNEWCLRIRNAGWKVYYDPQAEIVHLAGRAWRRIRRHDRPIPIVCATSTPSTTLTRGADDALFAAATLSALTGP